MKTGYGWACQPVVAPTAYSWRRTTMSIGDFASALNRPPFSGYDMTLKASKVPRARTVGTTPDGADAAAIAPPMAMSASAATATATSNRARRRTGRSTMRFGRIGVFMSGLLQGVVGKGRGAELEVSGWIGMGWISRFKALVAARSGR